MFITAPKKLFEKSFLGIFKNFKTRQVREWRRLFGPAAKCLLSPTLLDAPREKIAQPF
jgi:hypothetical protein